MQNGRWTVLLADDEPAARRGVRQLLAPFPQFRVVDECRDGNEVLAALDTLRPDLLFLDIQMPEVDGFEVVRRRTPERMPAVVFLTAYDQFAIRAFDAAAHDYLVKPVSESRFAVTMRRVARRLEGSNVNDESLVVTTATGATVLPLVEIDWIESAGNYARLWVAGRSYLIRESLDDLDTRLARHGFARAHRQALARIGSVRALQTNDGGETVALLACGARVAVSRRRRASFAAALRAR
jgi:two-component system LytT family response regulator